MTELAIPALDLAALGLFAVCWLAYALLANHVVTHRPSLVSEMRVYRHRWIARMSERENHTADATLLSNLLRGALFFASTTVLILGGLFALLGTAPKVSEVIGQLPYATPSNASLAEIKSLILIFVYVYAFFKFTWSAWQYNVLAILVGAMPDRRPGNEDEANRHSETSARVLVLAGENYNNGTRAYYFSIPLMAWFVAPALFIATTLIVTIVLYRREFTSPVLAALRHPGAPRA